MITKVEQLRCGECGQELHRLYRTKEGNLIAECCKCESQSIIKIIPAEILIRNHSGSGTLCIPIETDE